MKKQSKSSMILWFPDSYVCPAAYVILFVKNQKQDAHYISINKLTPGRQDSMLFGVINHIDSRYSLLDHNMPDSIALNISVCKIQAIVSSNHISTDR